MEEDHKGLTALVKEGQGGTGEEAAILYGLGSSMKVNRFSSLHPLFCPIFRWVISISFIGLL